MGHVHHGKGGSEMKKTWLLIALGLLLAFWVWYRKPSGPSTGDSGLPGIKGLIDFDRENPNADGVVRQTFFNGVQAHLSNSLELAKVHYEKVLSQMPDEPTTKHNLGLIDRLLGRGRGS
jgi:hypothetical protein